MEKKLSATPEYFALLRKCVELVKAGRHEYVTPEHLLRVFFDSEYFLRAFAMVAVADADAVIEALDKYLDSLDRIESGQEDADGEADAEDFPELSFLMEELLKSAYERAASAGRDSVDDTHLLAAILETGDAYAAQLLHRALDGHAADFISAYITMREQPDAPKAAGHDSGNPEADSPAPAQKRETWRDIVVCINDCLHSAKPLIGRLPELERTIQVLCRREKNNPLHVGHPGVGKTALVYGLARMIESGEVPERLKGSRIYRLDIGPLLAGTQYRGDMEKRIKEIMDGLAREKGAIVYIDEIHSLVGAGAVGESSMDASNMLKPYLEAGEIRFIGATTYDEYNRYFAKSKSLVRRFQQIDILEPSVEETIEIARQLQASYEEFHNVVYTPEAIVYAVEAAARHINDRFLPDKALDVIDEAGAYRELHPADDNSNTVDKQLISTILSKVCKVENLEIAESGASLRTLRERMEAAVFGQNNAIEAVADAVQMAKAGLIDENKPIASLLFVGPTGVGKTEVARVLAKELGAELIRFDMSEYAEKHTVAKLIGAPAGYVGYEDGALLVDAVRRAPGAVVLLDEIEKAHPDIYNILLQVMDYATLTDNHGQKADFRNVVLIMTSNAGAQFAKSAVGFLNPVSAGEAMNKEVRKLFKPEFINRLSATVVFREIDRDMASRILEKKIALLNELLAARNVSLTVAPEAFALLLEKGFSPQYGAREIDREIGRRLKPLLMREILYGDLADGGTAEACVADGEIVLKTDRK